MSTVRVEAQLSTHELLRAVEQLGTDELEAFTRHLLALRANRVAISLPKTESELLIEVNRGVPDSVQRRFDELVGKRLNETLSQAEHDELISLTDQMEALDVRRAELLVDLARLRGISLSALAEDLGISPPPDGLITSHGTRISP